MVGSRTLTALVGLLGSLAVSAALYWYTGSVLFFLFVPFVPFLFGSGGLTDESERQPKRCDRCGFETTEESYDYCPRDGSRLVDTDDDY
jgi:hypothetical protein